MNEDLVTKQDLDQFRREILSDFLSVLKMENETQSKILRSKDVIKLLGISENRLYKMRCAHEIPFRKFGRLTFYKLEDIYAIINNQSINQKNKNCIGNRFNGQKTKIN